jgi:hypothetical protein
VRSTKDQSTNGIRRANVRATKINLQTGSKEQMCDQQRSICKVQTGSDEQMKDHQTSIWKQDKKSQCEIRKDQSARHDQKSKCEINKDQSANKIRRANVISTKINQQTGSEEPI